MDAKIAEILAQSPSDVSEDRIRGILEGMGGDASVTDILAILWKLPPKVAAATGEQDEWRARNDYMDSLYEDIQSKQKRI